MASSSSSSTSNEFAKCIVCSDGMTSTDLSLPPPCYQYNCDASVCLPCLTKILSSSTLFKAPTCPDCGSNMNSKDLKDTILLRRYKLVKLKDKLPDSELGATELRERKAFAKGSDLEREVKALVEQKRGDELAKLSSIKEALAKQDSTSENIADGQTDAMKYPVDESFFKGRLDYSAMTDEEKCYVSNLLTSGDANQLAQAAQILMGISTIYASNTASSPPSSQTARGGRKKRANALPEAKALPALAIVNQHPKEIHKFKKLEELKARHPLPKHMPKCISLSAKEFGDPYNKRTCLLRFKNEDPSHRTEESDDKKKTPRVLVRLARGKAEKFEVMKGDVVTHFNGEVFEGTKDYLRNLIRRSRKSGNEGNGEASGEEFTIIFNADDATAKALRDREVCLITRSLGLLEL